MVSLEQNKEWMTNLDKELKTSIDETRKALDEIEWKWDDKKKFDTLSKDKDVQSWWTKIFEVSCNKAMKKEFLELNHINVKETLNKLIKEHKDLRLFICGDLQLPLNCTNFSQLTTVQKLNFTALYHALQVWKDSSIWWKLGNIWYKSPTSSENIKYNFDKYLGYYREDINSKFKYINISNFLNLEKTLKDDFKLSDVECKKCTEYLLLIKKHPDFIWLNEMQMAKGGAWLYLVFFILGAIAWVLWYYAVTHFGKWNSETINEYWGVTEITTPEEILRLLTQESKFQNSGSSEKLLFEIEDDDSFIEEIGKRVINIWQRKEVHMTLEWKIALQYDLKKYSKMIFDKSKWEITLKVCPPTAVITEAQPHIDNMRNERIWSKEFNNVETELEESLKQKAIDEATSNPNFYEVAKRNTHDQLLRFLEKMQPYWIAKINSLKVIYVDENWNELQDMN